MSEVACPREGCEVATGGKCLEGFDPSSTCPYLLTGIAALGVESKEASSWVDLPSGESLSEIEASIVTREGPSKVVVIAGPVGSGKTTILTSLFEAFLEAPFGSYMFAGSRTLAGFERRCHDARTSSGRSQRHTARTPISDTVEFLHLRLAPVSPSLIGTKNLLLSDISGERIKALRDSSEAVKQMKVLRRADHLCLVIDGDKMADAKHRHSARNDARMLLRSLIEADALAPDCNIQVIFSKWDVVAAYSDDVSIKSFIEETKTTISEGIKTNYEVEFLDIAARPETGKVPFAYGLPTLLRSWLEDPTSARRPPLYLSLTGRESREISRFGALVTQTAALSETYDVQRG